LIASLIVLIFGPGKISADALLTGRMSGSQVGRTVDQASPVAVRH
jgi:hypothetical protein